MFLLGAIGTLLFIRCLLQLNSSVLPTTTNKAAQTRSSRQPELHICEGWQVCRDGIAFQQRLHDLPVKAQLGCRRRGVFGNTWVKRETGDDWGEQRWAFFICYSPPMDPALCDPRACFETGQLDACGSDWEICYIVKITQNKKMADRSEVIEMELRSSSRTEEGKHQYRKI